MIDIVFREYDIRGKVGSEFLIEQVYDTARAIAYYLADKNNNLKSVLVGMDGRIHSPLIKEKVCKALMDSGLDVIFIGVVPSPVLYFGLETLPVGAGLMITASHNPKEYNGIKICLGTKSVWGKQIQEILHAYKAGKKLERSGVGKYEEKNLLEFYFQFLEKHFVHLKNMPLSAVIDCGNATGSVVIPELIKRMNWHHVSMLYCTLDGTMPNHEADPTKEKNMLDVKRVLKETKAQVGIGLDGDGDRMAAMTKDGYLVPGDKLLAVFAEPIVQKLSSAVVFDIKSSQGLSELLIKWGAKPIMSPSGHAIVKEYMKKNKALIGGELSCHFFFFDRYFGFDDGIYAMLRLFEILQKTGKTLAQLIASFPIKYSSPEVRINCPEDKKKKAIQAVEQFFADKNADILTIDGVHATLDYGWTIVRPSNTQPVLSIRAESDTKEGLDQIKMDLFTVLQNHVEKDTLARELQLQRTV